MTTTMSPEPVPAEVPVPGQRPPKARRRPSGARSLFDGAIVKRAALDSFVKLDPRTLAKNPVMFVVEVGSVLTTILFFRDLGSSTRSENVFAGLVVVFLWFTVLFANFAEAMAEGRGKAQAATLRKTRSETVARVRRPDGVVEEISSTTPSGRRTRATVSLRVLRNVAAWALPRPSAMASAKLANSTVNQRNT